MVVAAVAGCGSPTTAAKANALIARGLRAQTQGHLAEARADYERALKADPRNKVALYDLGVIEEQSAKTPAAVRDYKKALKIDPKYVPALFNLAVLRTPDAPEDAVALYLRVLKAKPSQASAHLNLGFLLRQLGQETAGNAELLDAIRLDPQLASRVPVDVFPGLQANPTTTTTAPS